MKLNFRRRLALVLSALGMILATLCLCKTNSLTMMGFFALGLPLHALSILVYLYDLAIVSRERGA